MSIFVPAMIVFSIVLLLTKAKIFSCQRKFVEERYQQSKLQHYGHVHPIHRIWVALWTCPMCAGWYCALVVCYLLPVYNLLIDIGLVFGLNWLLHCLEDLIFGAAKYFSEKIENSVANKKDVV